MKTLWTPWRMEYIKGKAGGKGCFFCAAPDLAHSAEDLILYRDRLLVVLMNRFPYASGHLLVEGVGMGMSPAILDSGYWPVG